MKEIIDAINNRINTPYFGYSIIAFLALNWRGFFYLFVAEGTADERLFLFDSHTSILSLIIYPLLIGFVVAVTFHWIRYIFAIIERKPRQLIEILNLEAENKKTIEQSKLEQSRTELFALKEKELIDRAKRDNEVANIEDNAKLINELKQVRDEREKMSDDVKAKSELVDAVKASGEINKLRHDIENYFGGETNYTTLERTDAEQNFIRKANSISKKYKYLKHINEEIQFLKDYVINFSR